MRVGFVATLQIIVCFLVAAAGLVPVAHKNRPFWGLYGISFDHAPPRIHQVDDGSPASDAGIETDDVILAINGSPADISALLAALESMSPGESARLRVQRGEAEIELTARAVEPPIAMIYYPTLWHPVAGGVCLALGLLVLATQPLRPAPRWRAFLVAAAGLACGVVFFLAVIYDSPFVRWIVRQFHSLNWGDRIHFEQNWVGLVGSLALALLGAWELRGLLASRRELDEQPNPMLPM